MKGALFSLFAVGAYAACPNGCSKHGECGAFDQCTCDDQFQGADCSLRTCMSGYAWVTTSRGDINFDGDTIDATVHSPDAAFRDTSVEYIVDQTNRGGTWESWPATFHQADDEGHFYMECSNRGLCDRETGECQCFEGYTGVACRRTVCPNDCSGHGLCLTVAQQSGSFEYVLWDADMSRSCKCDPGFSGPSCEELECPRGDDPLTTDQIVETQWVEIYSDNDADINTDGPFAGKFTLTYTDDYGMSYTTDAISVDSTSHTGLAAATEAALEALPNKVLADVAVTVDYCKHVIPMQVSLGDAAGMTETAASTVVTTAADFTDPATTHSVYCPGAASATPMSHFTGDVWKATSDMAGGSLSPGALTGETCYELVNPNCVRIAVTFTSTPGDLTDLAVGFAGITITNEDTTLDENTDQGATTIGARVNDALGLHAPALGTAISWTYEIEEDVKTCAADGCSVSGTTITVDADAADWQPDERVKITCGNKVIGTYTISADTESTGTDIYLVESSPACDGAAGNEVTLRRMTPYVEVNADLSGMLSPGDRIAFPATHRMSPPIRSISWSAWASTVDKGRILFEEGTGLHTTANVKLTAAVTAQATDLLFAGKGTTESSECSDRGVCDTEAGDCKCFGGYSGLACNLQNALSA